MRDKTEGAGITLSSRASKQGTTHHPGVCPTENSLLRKSKYIPRLWIECRDSKSGVINVAHGNPQLHQDQPDCHFLFCLSWTESYQQSFVLLLLFVIIPNLGLFLNLTYSKEKKNGTVTILIKLLVTIGNQSKLKFRFAVSRGSRWYIWFLRAVILCVGPTSTGCAPHHDIAVPLLRNCWMANHWIGSGWGWP